MSDQATDNARVKKTMGRRTVHMKQIENKSHLVTTFCKRRVGLFKKANELCTLCAVQMALVIFSPTKKPYSFGHPSADSVFDEFLSPNGSNANPGNLNRPWNGGTVGKLCEELAELKKRVKNAEKCGDELEKIRRANKNRSWWNKSLEDMSLSELEECKKAMEELVAAIPDLITVTGSADRTGLELAL